MPVELGYWKIRGLATPLRYQMAYSGVEYTMTEYEQEDDLSNKAWLDKKFTLGLDFPNLPYLIDGDFKMSETVPMHKYLADKYCPDLLGKTPQDRANVNMLGNNVVDLKMGITMPCYMSGKEEEVLAAIDKHLPGILKFKGNNKFLTGDNVTWLDFYFVEVVEFMSRVKDDLYTQHPALQTYKDTVLGLPKLKEYLDSDACIEKSRKFNNKSAKINFM